MANDPHAETENRAGFWTTSQAAEYLGVSPGRARVILQDVDPVDRRTGRGGEHVYRASAVRAAKKRMPGQGSRTDLR